MTPRTRLILGTAGVGLAAALITGAAVWAVMSARVADATRECQNAEERISELESEVASLTAQAGEGATDDAPQGPDASSDSTSSESETSMESGDEQVADVDRQFCFVRGGSWEGDRPLLSVDYAELLTGAEAASEAASRGDESPPPNDVYIVNDNPRLRSIPVDPETEVRMLSSETGLGEPYVLGLGQWYDVLAGMSGSNYVKNYPYWITVEHGVITAIEEQYLP